MAQKFRSVVALVIVVVILGGLPGCATEESEGPNVTAAGDSHPSSTPGAGSAEGAAEQPAGPTVFGVDGELQAELRSVLAAFIEQPEVPGDPEENLARAFDAAMATIRRPAVEFGIDPDADGNHVWPDELQQTVETLRSQYDAGTLFESYEVDLPDWAAPLLEDYQSDSLTPVRRELLFRLACSKVMLEMA